MNITQAQLDEIIAKDRKQVVKDVREILERVVFLRDFLPDGLSGCVVRLFGAEAAVRGGILNTADKLENEIIRRSYPTLPKEDSNAH